MEFCILSPVSGLERYATLSKTHLLLPQLDGLEGYREFYQKRKAAGDFIILDNGAYEGQTDWKKLVDCINIYNPNICALPDYLLQPWGKTLRHATDFLDRWHYTFNNSHRKVKWMYIPQAVEGDIVGFIDGLFRALTDERISAIGIPRALSYGITCDPLMRAKVGKEIRKRYSNIYLHALGMVKGSLHELASLNGIAHSIDSNAPVWRGWCGYSLTNGRWDEIPVNYSMGLEAILYPEVILENLEACGVRTNHSSTR